MSTAKTSFPFKSWPFLEAQKLAERIEKTGKQEVLFETGYGPSGLPHIGTFGEVARTSWIRRAFAQISDLPTKLLAFSDDMDGLRKVPENVPNKDMLQQYLGMPLSVIPDPFDKYPSFGAHNNAMLCRFLDSFGFDYEFASATDYYRSGRFDEALLTVLKNFEAVKNAVLPTLGAERQQSYSPILPIHPKTGQVMQVAVEPYDKEAGLIRWRDPETGIAYETKVTGGACKLQWKADWAMRWYALGVDYEMSGKDLIESVRLSSKICRILGKEPPLNLTYELFLDEQGQKISKSKGNGLSVEEWLRYAPAESLSQFMYNAPTRAKRLYFDVIPRAADEYAAHVHKALQTSDESLKDNPAWHINAGMPPSDHDTPLSFTMLLNLASVVNASSEDILWGFIKRYSPQASAETMPYLALLAGHAVAYYQDFVAPQKKYRAPDEKERAALNDLKQALEQFRASEEAGDLQAETLQNMLYETGKKHQFENLREWFQALYQILLGQDEGPRFGGFIALYGTNETAELIRQALEGQLAI